MNKRHYEHTLPNIRGSLSNTYENFDAVVLDFDILFYKFSLLFRLFLFQ